MLDEDHVADHAKSIAAALRVMGKIPRKEVIEILCRLRMSEDEATAVIAHGLALRILVEDGEDMITGVTRDRSG